jgi:PAS domain S-box-containing protein
MSAQDLLLNNLDYLFLLDVVVAFTFAIRVMHSVVAKKFPQFTSIVICWALTQSLLEGMMIILFNLNQKVQVSTFIYIVIGVICIYFGYSAVVLIRVIPFKIKNKKKIWISRAMILLVVFLLTMLPLILVIIRPELIVIALIEIGVIYIAAACYFIYYFRELVLSGDRLAAIVFMLGLVFLVMTIYMLWSGFFSIDSIASQIDTSTMSRAIAQLVRTAALIAIGLFINRRFIVIEQELGYKTNTTRVVRIFMAIFAVMSIVVFGILNFVNQNKEAQMYSELGLQTNLIHAMIDKEKLAGMTGSVQDLESADYNSIRNQLTDIANASKNLRYLYIYGLEGDQVVNYIEVHPDVYGKVEADDFFPGDIYTEPSDVMMSVLTTGISATEGPLKDEYGSWISAFEPITLPDGRVLLLGVDIDARTWLGDMYVARNQITVIATLFVFIVFVVFDAVLGFITLTEGIKLSELKLQNLFDSSTDALLILKDGVIQEANKRLLRLFKLNKSDVIGKTLLHFSSKYQENQRESAMLWGQYWEIVNHDNEIIFEWQLDIHKQQFFCEIALTKFKTMQEEYVQVILRDITNKRKTEQEKEKHLVELERLNKLMIGRELRMIELKKEIQELKFKE